MPCDPLKDEQERGPDILRLANALSALYHKDSEEKRLLGAIYWPCRDESVQAGGLS